MMMMIPTSTFDSDFSVGSLLDQDLHSFFSNFSGSSRSRGTIQSRAKDDLEEDEERIKSSNQSKKKNKKKGRRATWIVEINSS